MKYFNGSLIFSIPAIIGLNLSLWAEEIHQTDDVPQEAVKHTEKGATNRFIEGWDDDEVLRLAKLLKVPPSDVDTTLNLLEEKTENFLRKYFRPPSSDNCRIACIKDQKLLADFTSECKMLIEINSPLFLFKDTNINKGILLPPELEAIVFKKFFDKNESNLLEPQFMGIPVEDFTKQLILYSVSFGLASTQSSEVLMQFLHAVSNHLPPTVGDIIVFRGVYNGLRDASIEMQSIGKPEDENIKIDIKLVDWKRLALAKNPIYRFLAIYSPYDNFQYTNEELLEFYQAYSNETDPEIRKYVMGGLKAILEDKEGIYKSIINNAKKLYDELEKKWR
ncbi:MAG TPA: hypothetical protein P5270_03200 [Victivallales bacterium]|nr:hypothetical protein [Victivallales bacterium]HRU01665.1 hypothetical protein [Victivallales bacterium]